MGATLLKILETKKQEESLFVKVGRIISAFLI